MSVNAKLLFRFREALDEGGLPRAIRFLNQTVAYRFSAVYVFSGGTLRNICLVDKFESEVSKSDDIPVEESYCVFIRRTAKPFSVFDSLSDPRVDGHSKQQIIHSYYGLPLIGEAGQLLGTVCHFDYDTRPLAEETVDFLDAVAPLIVDALNAGP
jgi:GAF domain-containing protein